MYLSIESSESSSASLSFSHLVIYFLQAFSSSSSSYSLSVNAALSFSLRGPIISSSISIISGAFIISGLSFVSTFIGVTSLGGSTFLGVTSLGGSALGITLGISGLGIALGGSGLGTTLGGVPSLCGSTFFGLGGEAALDGSDFF